MRELRITKTSSIRADLETSGRSPLPPSTRTSTNQPRKSHTWVSSRQRSSLPPVSCLVSPKPHTPHPRRKKASSFRFLPLAGTTFTHWIRYHLLISRPTAQQFRQIAHHFSSPQSVITTLSGVRLSHQLLSSLLSTTTAPLSLLLRSSFTLGARCLSLLSPL